MADVTEVLGFWLDEVGADGWYRQDDALDAEIRARFLDDWTQASQGAGSSWLTHPSGTLAYIILTDQFPRNMFRGEARAFSTDALALAVAKVAVGKGWDRRIDAPARQFFYLPMMHSEGLTDQERCVRLMDTRMPGTDNLLHARAHREVIRRFGRFPHRNDALGRPTLPRERAFLDDGGYGAVVRALQSEVPAPV